MTRESQENCCNWKILYRPSAIPENFLSRNHVFSRLPERPTEAQSLRMSEQEESLDHILFIFSFYC